MKRLFQVAVVTGVMLGIAGAFSPTAVEAHGGNGMSGHTGGMSHSSSMHRGGYINPWLLYPYPYNYQKKRKPAYPTGPFSAFNR